MNGTGSLFRRSAEFLWRHPIVLVPALAARLVDFAIYWVCGLSKGPAMKAVAPHSVLGGISGKVDAPVVAVAAVFTFLPLLCEVSLLVYSMAVTGRWAHGMRQEDDAVGREWTAPAGSVARVSLLTLCVGAVTAWAGLYFTLHGGVPVRWAYLVTWCFLILAAWFVLPSWLRLLAEVEGVRVRDTSKVPPFVAMATGLAGFALALYLGIAVQRNLELTHHIRNAAVPFLVNLAVALVSALPLAFGFVAMSRSVADRPGWQPE